MRPRLPGDGGRVTTDARANLAAMRRRFGLSLKGATLKDLVTIAERVGFASRAVRLDIDELPC